LGHAHSKPAYPEPRNAEPSGCISGYKQTPSSSPRETDTTPTPNFHETRNIPEHAQIGDSKTDNLARRCVSLPLQI
jgi:hypothetical protein